MYNQSFTGSYGNAARMRSLLQEQDYLDKNKISKENAELYDDALRAQQGQAVAGGIITGLTGATTLLSNAFKDAQIRDTTMQENQIADLSRAGNYNYNNYDQLANDYAQTNFGGPNINYQDIRGMTTGQKIGSVGTSMLSGAATGLQIGGPWGCVCAGTRVMSNDGRFVNIEDLAKEDGIVGWNGDAAIAQSIFDFQAPAEKECVQIEFDNGEVLRCSTDHPILYHKPGRNKRKTINRKRRRVPEYSFTNAQNLVVGDWVGSISEMPIWGNTDISDARLIGMLIGDGTYGQERGARLFTSNPETWNYIEGNNLGYQINDFKDSQYYQTEFRCYRIYNGASILREHGIYGQTRSDKRLPNDIAKFTKKAVAELIAGLFDTDGCIPNTLVNKEHRIEFTQSNYDLLIELKEQLLKFGIHSYVRKSNARKAIDRFGRTINSRKGYRLIIKDADSVMRFKQEIPLLLSYKSENLADAVDYKESVSLRRPRYNGVYPVRVKKIVPIGKQRIYNLQADDYHTYIANGIITHNSLIGGVIGLGTGLGGVLTGNAAARTRQESLNIQAQLAADAAQQNFAAAHERIGDNIHRQNAVNAVAEGGQIRRQQSIKEYADRVLGKRAMQRERKPSNVQRIMTNGGCVYRVTVK